MNGHVAGGGDVGALEAHLRAYYGKKYALAVSSATTGLHGLALAIGLGRRDFVTTPYTYGASVAGWLLQGGRPVFADIDAETLTLDPAAAEAAITKRTRALLAVDIYGMPCDDDALRDVADRHGLWYVADASQSFGARRIGRPASSRAHALVVSFTSGKTLDAGEGGAVLTDDGDLYDRLLWWTQHPDRQRAELDLGVWNEFGLNGRMHPAAATLALERWERAFEALRGRQAWAEMVIRALNESEMTRTIWTAEAVEPAWFRVSASWRGHPAKRDLQEHFGARAIVGDIDEGPVRVLYAAPAFKAMHGQRSHLRGVCEIAEAEAMSRFVVRPPCCFSLA